MSRDDADLWNLAVTFGILSVFAVGGVSGLFAEMHRQAVDVHGWMTSDRFTDLFAIGQAAPGPNMLVVTLIGADVAGSAGALVATATMCGPSALLAFFVGGVWERFRQARWRIVVQAGLTPLAIGILAASAFLLARSADHNLIAAAVTLASAAALYFTRAHPLIAIAGGASIGAAGFI